MRNHFETWSYVKFFLFVALIIFLVVWICSSCSPVVSAQRGSTDSVWKSRDTYYGVRVKVDSCTSVITRWNAHCYCQNYSIPQVWDVTFRKNGKPSVKEVK